MISLHHVVKVMLLLIYEIQSDLTSATRLVEQTSSRPSTRGFIGENQNRPTIRFNPQTEIEFVGIRNPECVLMKRVWV